MGWGAGIALSCGVGRRRGLDLASLWLCCRPGAVALIQPLGWDSPYAVGVALKSQKRKKTKNKNVERRTGAWEEKAGGAQRMRENSRFSGLREGLRVLFPRACGVGLGFRLAGGCEQ